MPECCLHAWMLSSWVGQSFSAARYNRRWNTTSASWLFDLAHFSRVGWEGSLEVGRCHLGLGFRAICFHEISPISPIFQSYFLLASVSDEEMIEAMKFVFQRMKLAIEISAASGIAAVQSAQFQNISQKHGFSNVGVILCGGNTDLDKLPWVTE